MLVNFGQGSIDSKLYENFRMEYYLALTEYLMCADRIGIDRFDLKMYLDDVNGYLESVSAAEDENNVYIDRIGDYYKKMNAM